MGMCSRTLYERTFLCEYYSIIYGDIRMINLLPIEIYYRILRKRYYPFVLGGMILSIIVLMIVIGIGIYSYLQYINAQKAYDLCIHSDTYYAQQEEETRYRDSLQALSSETNTNKETSRIPLYIADSIAEGIILQEITFSDTGILITGVAQNSQYYERFVHNIKYKIKGVQVNGKQNHTKSTERITFSLQCLYESKSSTNEKNS